jgi:hypothetical protein
MPLRDRFWPPFRSSNEYFLVSNLTVTLQEGLLRVSFEYFDTMLSSNCHEQSHLYGFHDRGIQFSKLVVHNLFLLITHDAQSNFVLFQLSVNHFILSGYSSRGSHYLGSEFLVLPP